MSTNREQESTVKKEDKQGFTPLDDVNAFVSSHFYAGDLGLYIMAIVLISNFIFFQSPFGYGFYYWTPVMFVVLSTFSKYWETIPDWKHYAGLSILILAAIWDAIISISYLWTVALVLTSPAFYTLIFDIGAITYIIYWRLNLYDEQKLLR